MGFWAADRPFLALNDLKPVLARCKWAENALEVPCCTSSPIIKVIWRKVLDYDLGGRNNGFFGHCVPTVGTRDGLETANLAFNALKVPCCGQHFQISCFAYP